MGPPAHAARRGVLAFVLALATGILRVASGDEAAGPVRLDVTSSAGCPDPATFEALVRARTPRSVLVRSGLVTRSIEAHLQAGPPPSGSMTLRRGEGIEGTRTVTAGTCSDAAEALALVVTLAIDPAALAAPAPAPAPSAPSTSVPPARAPHPAPVGSVATPTAERPGARPGRLPHSLWLGADVVLTTGLPGESLVGVSPGVGWRGTSTSVVSPSVHLGLLHAASDTLSPSMGAASFAWTVGQADGCIVSWPRGPARLIGCARAEAGVLHGAGTSVASPQTSDRAWVAAGPLVRGEWALLPPLFLTAELAFMIHVTEDRFYFRPDTTVYQVPVAGLETGGGLGVHFF